MQYREVLDFWFSDPKKWFNGGDDFDKIVQNTFGDIYQKAIEGELDDWIYQPESCLALIILLDQFSRNMFRGSQQAFEYDFKALYTTKIALKKGFLDGLEGPQKTFLVMPLMHSESLPDQDECIKVFQELAKTDKRYETNVQFAKEHRDIIKNFGRFPHRNKILSRESTDDEVGFLTTHSGF